MTDEISGAEDRRRWIENLVMLIEGEFLENPTRLTVPQAQRRFGVAAA